MRLRASRAVVQEWQAEHGAFTPDELAAARAELAAADSEYLNGSGARHSLALGDGRDIHIPSVVVSQAWRDSRRQVRLGTFLAGCHVVPVGLESAKAAGVLCGRTGTTDIVAATVVAIAASLGAIIWTSDPDDIHALADAQDIKPALVIRTV